LYAEDQPLLTSLNLQERCLAANKPEDNKPSNLALHTLKTPNLEDQMQNTHTECYAWCMVTVMVQSPAPLDNLHQNQ